MISALLALGFSILNQQPACALTLVYSNDVLGEIEPCGCRTNPYGGMIRKANLLKERQGQQKEKEVLILDAGDLLFPTTPMPDVLENQSKLQAGYLLKSMDLIHHDAAVPGEKDFALGVKAFESLIKKSKVKFLGANVKYGGKPFLKPYEIFRRDGLRVAVIGLLGMPSKDLKWPSDLKITDPVMAAKALAVELKGKADLIIALTHQEIDADKTLAQKVPALNMIVGGHSQAFLQEPLQIGNTFIYESSYRNQYIGFVPLKKTFKGDGHELLGLSANYDDPEGKPCEMGKLVQEFRVKLAELNTKEGDAQLAAVATAGKGKPIKYQTFVRCAECHLKQFDFWRKTAHAKALHPLLKDLKYKNKECLSCHSVGLGDPQGFNSVETLAFLKEGSPHSADELAYFLGEMNSASSVNSKVKISKDGEEQPLKRAITNFSNSWVPVQCENCHQPGQEHPFFSNYSKNVEKNLCLTCHSKERAPDWYLASGQPDWDKIADKRKSITCPAGEMDLSD